MLGRRGTASNLMARQPSMVTMVVTPQPKKESFMDRTFKPGKVFRCAATKYNVHCAFLAFHHAGLQTPLTHAQPSLQHNNDTTMQASCTMHECDPAIKDSVPLCRIPGRAREPDSGKRDRVSPRT